MNKTIKIFSNISFAVLLLLVASCSSGKQDELAKEFEQQKEQAIERLEYLSIDVDKALEDIENNLTINEARLKGIKEDVLDRKKMLAGTIEKAKNATQQEWKSVKMEVDETASSVASSMKAFKADIKSAIDSVKEDISEIKNDESDS
ncbi:MAG: hypothetical protein ABJP45_16515 [Cyclobacteriaceae bacterium]